MQSTHGDRFLSGGTLRLSELRLVLVAFGERAVQPELQVGRRGAL